MGTHARLSASSSHRWISCPGSLRLIDALPRSEQNTTSVYAAEGHAAHYLAAHCLRNGKRAEEFLGQWACEDSMVPERPSNPGNAQWFEVDEEMADAVQVYLDRIEYHRLRLPNGEEVIEQRFDMSHVRPDMGGTADYGRYEMWGELVIVDYKHGKGVPVEVEWNTQEMYYAVGLAQAACGGLDDVDTVTIEIVQPRCGHVAGPVRSWSISAAALAEWVDGTLAPAADRTREPDAPLAAGEWCRFCPAAGSCPKLRETALQEAMLDFDAVPLDEPLDPDNYDLPLPADDDPEAITRAMNALPVIEAWCKAVGSLAFHRLERGRSVPHYKLVRKGTRRKLRDPEDAERRLRNKKGVTVDDMYAPRKLKTPRQLELTPSIGKEWVAKHAIMPEGALTIAHASDPRPPANPPAINDFDAQPEHVIDAEYTTVDDDFLA